MILAPRSSTHSSSVIAFVEDRQGDHRGGEDSILVVVGPLVMQPVVDGMDRRVSEVGVAGDGVLDEVRDGREHQRPLNTELIEQLDSRPGSRKAGMQSIG